MDAWERPRCDARMLTPSIDAPQSIPVCFLTRVVPGSRAQSLGVIEPNSL